MNVSVLGEAENIIDAVQLLHSLAYDVATIAQRLHIDQATTLYVITTGQLPQRQSVFTWARSSELPE